MNEKLGTLNEREWDILRLIAQGLTSRRIAENLSLSTETIRWYRKRLLSKFDADNAAEMIQIAIKNNLL